MSSKNPILLPQVEGTASRQAHCDLPDGTFEREMGREGFFGPATHLYHTHAPTGWTSWEGPTRPHAFDTREMKTLGASPWDATTMLSNATCQMRMWSLESAMDHLVRNADGDELLFIHNGAGSLFCDFGHMTYRDGDYVVLPRGTMWRLEPSERTDVLMIESTGGSYELPDRGSLGPHAVFDPGVLETSHLDDAFFAQQGEEEWKVVMKRRSALSTITYPFNPLDATGWKGNMSAVKLNWRDIRPVMSARYHVPPSAHTTFVGNRFVICTFCPRPIESDPGALKVPFYHSNDDYDEVLFYHRGDFFSRDNIEQGMITFHPSGFPHGPHPKAYRASMENPKTATDEVAVMVDTRDALDLSDAAMAVENVDYVYSWKETS
jgi:homogentisate 1,2-dioxygenase